MAFRGFCYHICCAATQRVKSYLKGSKNEWEVANSSKNYELHLWVIKPKISLYIFKIEDLKNNIPLDSGNGEWQNVKIHFLKEDIESNKMIIDKFSIFEK